MRELNKKDVVLFQIGRREHYALAKILHRHGRLNRLVTDLFFKTFSFKGRNDSELNRVTKAFNWLFIPLQIAQRFWNANEWVKIDFYNRLFQAVTKAQVKLTAADYVIAYSYAAKSSFKLARKSGKKCILMQIDGGLKESDLICEIDDSYIPPNDPQYWSDWKIECDLADLIIVNSQWSKSLLPSEHSHKAKILPLAYDFTSERKKKRQDYQPSTRALKILFLGQICTRKGADMLINAAASFTTEEAHFRLVGPWKLRGKASPHLPATCSYAGVAEAKDVATHYQWADVFILPTHSDGFAITQLESLSHGVPVIASMNCGQVVRNGENGFQIEEVSVANISLILGKIISGDLILPQIDVGAEESRFSLENIGDLFISMLEELDEWSLQT